MPSLWFVCPAAGRAQLARICLTQLRRTCDALADYGIDATAVVVADDENLDTARALGFGTVERDNEYVSRKFNDGIQLALERPLPPKPREATHGEYLVTGRSRYRDVEPGRTFIAKIPPAPERRAIQRGDIQLLQRVNPRLEEGSYTLPDGWPANRSADYVVPVGSDDFVDASIFARLPDAHTIYGYRTLSFVREDGRQMVSRRLTNEGGCGIRIYPRQLLRAMGCRPADEHRKRGCDTSILNNVRAHHGDRLRVLDVEIDPRQIVDWKSPAEQLNGYDDVRRHPEIATYDYPFDALADIYPEESLDQMRDHYHPPGGKPDRPTTEARLAGLSH